PLRALKTSSVGRRRRGPLGLLSSGIVAPRRERVGPPAAAPAAAVLLTVHSETAQAAGIPGRNFFAPPKAGASGGPSRHPPVRGASPLRSRGPPARSRGGKIGVGAFDPTSNRDLEFPIRPEPRRRTAAAPAERRPCQERQPSRRRRRP